MLRLRTISGPDAGRVHELPPEEPQILGRSTEALPSSDRTVSRRHAELTPRDGLWLVRDLASKAGTFVNGARIHGHQALRVGDRVRVGETVLLVERADGTTTPLKGQDRAALEPGDVLALETPGGGGWGQPSPG